VYTEYAASSTLRVEKLVALLSALQALDALGMHLLGHLFVASLFFLGSALVLDALDVGLESVSDVAAGTRMRI
jgi:hypothetical protein